MPAWLASFFQRTQLTPPDRPAAPRWPLFTGIIIAIWLSLLLYADTLGIPFLQEDSFHIRWLSDRSVLQPFWDATGAPDYRPLGKAIIKAWYEMLGSHDRARTCSGFSLGTTGRLRRRDRPTESSRPEPGSASRIPAGQPSHYRGSAAP